MVNATPRPFYIGKDTVAIAQEAGLTSAPVWPDTEYLVPTEIRSPDRPARSELPYRLRYEHSNEPTDCTNGRLCLDYLSDYHHLYIYIYCVCVYISNY